MIFDEDIRRRILDGGYWTKDIRCNRWMIFDGRFLPICSACLLCPFALPVRSARLLCPLAFPTCSVRLLCPLVPPACSAGLLCSSRLLARLLAGLLPRLLAVFILGHVLSGLSRGLWCRFLRGCMRWQKP